MTSNSSKPTGAVAEAAKREYADLAGLYAEQRSETAEALGRKAEEREWRIIESETEQDDKGQAPN